MKKHLKPFNPDLVRVDKAGLRALVSSEKPLDAADFVCKRCGLCCGLIFFSEQEYKIAKMPALKQGIILTPIFDAGNKVYMAEKTVKTLGKSFPKFKETKELSYVTVGFKISCAFLSQDENGISTCIIHEHRPQICRKWGTEVLIPCPGFVNSCQR